MIVLKNLEDCSRVCFSVDDEREVGSAREVNGCRVLLRRQVPSGWALLVTRDEEDEDVCSFNGG